MLVAGSSGSPSSSTPGTEDTAEAENNQNNNGSMTTHINDLVDVVKTEMLFASRQGPGYKFTQRAERMLRRAAVIAIKGSLRDLVDAWVDRIGEEKELKEANECLSTPATTIAGKRSDSTTTTELQRRVIFPTGETPNSGQQSAQLISPPVVDLMDDDLEEDERDVDIILTQIKEETILQNLLHKRMMENNHQRVLTLEHKNGRKFRVILPPDSQSAKAFIDDAKKTQWVNMMLHSESQRRGMLLCLATTQPKAYLRVGEQKKIRITMSALNTAQTLALGRLAGINDTQLARVRSFLKHVGKTELKHSTKELARIDRDVGLHKCMPATFNTYTMEWSATGAKGVEKKPPETCSCWNCDLILEVAAEIDLVVSSMFLEKPEMTTMPPLDYGAPGFSLKGVVVLFGGDHGAGACPCSLKLNLSPPEERKERVQLNCRCPTMQIASIDCSKDSFELLSNAVMPKLRVQMIELRNSSAVVVHSLREPKKHNKVFLLPKICNSVHVINNLLCYRVGHLQRTIDLCECFERDTSLFWPLHALVTTVISNFHDLHVGNLALLAMSIGMNNSSGQHCVQCLKKASNFNCPIADPPNDLRTKASLTQCLNEHNARRLSSKSVRNHQGVNTVGLLDVDPQRIIVPILHCPMGLVDKILETFKAWVIFEIEELPEEAKLIRETCKSAKEAHVAAVAAENAARNEAETPSSTPEHLAVHKDAQAARKVAKKEEAKSKLNCDEMVKRHNSRLCSLSQSFDATFRANGIKKEHFHGGKCNGVNCIRIMDKADELFAKFAVSIKEKKVLTAQDAQH